MKDRKDVIIEFNSLVNMTASDLESWLKSDDSNSAGWPKDGGDDNNGETVGHDSGRKIVEILKANPGQEDDEYTDEHVEHMRKVVSYCKRHLAQESKGNSEKSEKELKKTKSYASLKNWGHDILKAKGEHSSATANSDSNSKDKTGDDHANSQSVDKSASNGSSKSKSPTQTPKRQRRSSIKDAKESEKEEDEEEDPKGDEAGDDNEGTARPGQKRKVANGKQNGAHKKQETSKGVGAEKQRADEGEAGAHVDDEEKVEDEKDEEMVDADDDDKQEANRKKTSGKADFKTKAGENDGGDETNDKGDDGRNGPSKGDTVSWKWGNNHPEGKVLDVKEEDTSITTKNGNQVNRKGTKDDPAVVLDAGKSKAIKKAHELD